MRLKAKFMLALDASALPTAEELLREALSRARDGGAAALALRAATALARILGERGGGEEAQSILTTAVDSVEGGETTLDVREGRAVLADLAVGVIETRELR
jgi:hypothetical protein